VADLQVRRHVTMPTVVIFNRNVTERSEVCLIASFHSIYGGAKSEFSDLWRHSFDLPGFCISCWKLELAAPVLSAGATMSRCRRDAAQLTLLCNPVQSEGPLKLPECRCRSEPTQPAPHQLASAPRHK
jgi:hypothetical protein